MKRYARPARIWITATIICALGVLALTVRPDPVSGSEWFAFVALGVSAMIAHFFPVRSITNQATFSLTNVFLIAGVVILPLPLLCVLVICALTPQSWATRHRPGVMARWSFNVALTLLAINAAHTISTLRPVNALASPLDLATIAGAALIFIATQNLIVAMAMSLNTGRMLWRIDILRPAALLIEGLFAILGILAASMWLAKPWLLILVVPLLFVAHTFTRTAQMAELALMDAKTGLPNARGLERTLENALQRAASSRQSLGILFVDLDRFKSINDTYGHAVGDAVLREFGAFIQSTLRREDTVARFGGEEFVAVLPDIDTNQAAILAERLRAAVEGHRFMHERSLDIPITISVGVVAYPQDGVDVAALIDYADRAMYQAKATRNAIYVGDHAHPIAQLPAAPSHLATMSWRDRVHVGIPAPATLVLWGTVVLGTFALGVSVVSAWQNNAWLVVLTCVVAGIVSDLFPVRLYMAKQEKMTVTLTDVVVMALVTLQPLTAPLVNVAAALVHVITGKQRRLDKTLFNLTNPALAAGIAGGIYMLLRPTGGGFTFWNLAAGFVSSVALVLANSGIVALMVSMHSRRPLLTLLREIFWYTPITLLLAVIGAFIGAVSSNLGVIGVVMFSVPILLMRLTVGFSAKKNQEAIESLEAAKRSLESADAVKTKTLNQLIVTVSNIIDARDNLVWGHSRNVAEYARLMAGTLGLSKDEVADVYSAGLLHDLGKVAIPERILHKPGRLTDEEYTIVKEHPIIGKRILGGVDLLDRVGLMVGDHHERYDGDGYPHRKEGDGISIGGRILAVADALDTILSDRSYSTARTLNQALAEIDRCAGAQFDPSVVAALHQVVAEKGEGYFVNSALNVIARNTDPIPSQVIPFPRRVG